MGANRLDRQRSARRLRVARGPGSALARYVVAAALARGAMGGATVALVTLAVTAAGPGGHGAAAGGLLAAMLSVPTLVGPLCARPLDRARDGRQVLAAASAVFAMALTGGAAMVGRAPVALVAIVVGAAGLCNPLLTGGLSSRLAAMVGRDERSQRRAQGWDSVTYGLGGTVGPAAVAAITAAAGPFVAVVVLGCAALVASVVIMTLPASPGAVARADVPRVREVVGIIATSGPLRRVTVTSVLTAVAAGGLVVVAVVFGVELGGGAGAGAALSAAFGLGNLVGSAAVAVAPPRGEPERLTIRLTAAFGLVIALCAVAPGYGAAVAAFAAAGVVNGLLFPATLAVRSVHAPEEARAQVFVSIAGLKGGAASAGMALTGVAVGFGSRALLVGSAAVVVVSAVIAVLDRRLAQKSAPRSA